MKRTGIVLLLALLLTGCTGVRQEIERGMELRARLLAAQGCSFDVQITADYGEKVYIFGMICSGDNRGNLDFTVSSPDTIAGITGTVSEDGGALTFEDTALQFDLLAEDQASPVSAPWILLKTLRGGYLTSAAQEDDLLHLTINDSYEEDALTLDIWLNGENIPVRAEILYDGRRILSLIVSNFQIL